MNFSDLGLRPELVTAVTEKGYTEPTPIQLAAIPAVLSGRDVLAGAQTGTGKTAGFVLPILQRLAAREGNLPRALILTPTRELAAQVAESARFYGKNLNLRTQVVFGGVSERPQIDKLRAGCDILVATPGRLMDLVQQGVTSLSQVQVFVLDEADRMLDMGFIHAIKRIRALLPAKRQNLMFSATYSDDIRDLASRLLTNPQGIDVAPPNQKTADKVEQSAYRVSKEHKRHLLAHLIREGNWHQVLVFTRTKHGANRLAEQLDRMGIRSSAIHGNKSQGARVRALEDFKANRIVALVATEVAARGLDIKELPFVVNYELPNVPEDYVHRIGRTARAGSTGQAISLVAPDETSYMRDIVKLLGRDIPPSPTPQFEIREPAPSARDAEDRDDSAGRDTQTLGGPQRQNTAQGQRGRRTGNQAQGGGNRAPAQPGRVTGPQGARNGSARPAGRSFKAKRSFGR
ncbi:MAG: DEAD/DEAH box helicase [Pseudomonadota bacterium]